MLPEPSITILGADPSHRRCVLNGNAFQQDAITTFHGWQYAAFYSFLDPTTPEPLYVHLARRQLPSGPWETLVFRDYPQTVDDGHNTVQMGICPGDGSIHLSYDHHCDAYVCPFPQTNECLTNTTLRLRYRHSIANLALQPSSFDWSPSLFTPTLNHLPGLSPSHKPFHYVTYPRFISSPHTPSPLATKANTNNAPSSSSSPLFLSFRDGKAGLGNDHLYRYSPSPPSSPTTTNSANIGRYTYIGPVLTGIQSNPYVHGITISPLLPSTNPDPDHESRTKIHITWVWRGFVPYEGWDDPLDTKHKQQAGPNGMENNHDVCYVYCEDGRGEVWRNNQGSVVADLSMERQDGEIDGDGSGGGDGDGHGTNGLGQTVRNDSEGIVVWKVGKGMGLMNQEAQAVDWDGGVHVLNRDWEGEGGRYEWKHYYREPGGESNVLRVYWA